MEINLKQQSENLVGGLTFGDSDNSEFTRSISQATSIKSVSGGTGKVDDNTSLLIASPERSVFGSVGVVERLVNGVSDGGVDGECLKMIG